MNGIAEHLVNGLKRLEYRGYDSAGIAIYRKGELLSCKAVGTISAIEQKLKDENFYSNGSSVGIAHTRWATHGGVTESNAHPHFDEDRRIAIVHNGIIENAQAIRVRLRQEGVTFSSETDSEVIAHLIHHFLENQDLEHAVLSACREVQGTFGLCVLDRETPDKLIAARRGSPLVIGVGENFRIVSSDTSAIIPYTNQIVYMEDHEVAVVEKDSVRIATLDEDEVNRKVIELDVDLEAIELGQFPHYMLKEIFEQPDALHNVLRGRIILETGECKLGGLNLTDRDLSQVRRVLIISCGTSWHAGLIGEYYIESLARIPCEVEYASEFRYRNPVLDPQHDLAVVITQSGETADTLAALREVKQRGVQCLGICNVVGSTIAREVHGGTYTHAGPEIGVASTKAFTTQIAALLLLALHLGRRRHLDNFFIKQMAQDLSGLPPLVDQCLQKHDIVREAALPYKDASNALYLGRGYGFPIALEGALKLKEISYIHAEGYPAAEMKHGPIALIDQDMPVVVVATKDRVYEKVISNIEEVAARGGRIVAIVSEGDQEIGRLAETVIEVPQVREELMPFLTVIPLQLFAYYIAIARGCNVDKPRNLAKSVTVE